ncbi:hypothetical protein FRACYDRAFT_263691 [Fragilariopsis cylindrus CCMP1102]|uniref:Uncharacterized protein n=1 Tax=Fragilariopsis cylindrus CCMP1102 TaxID=635003 RepID=A0A1E7EY39_9STRA|nr:hypothetical protein FRACYDRAFT_263691 [Fragilariopsis cylindrus CCMP1102]|eukprot:OEU10746.1 hypothetical protein FRACYDRAFT_263691 [Fragilariopsis cylindrus CCMP1102]
MIQRLRVYRSLIGAATASSSSSSSSSLNNTGNNTVRRLLENISNSNIGRDDDDYVQHGYNNYSRPPRQSFPFDGVVLSLDQLLDTAAETTETTTMGGGIVPSSLLYDYNSIRIICQLEPECADDASDQLRRLAVFLDRGSVVVGDRKTMRSTTRNTTSTNTGSTTTTTTTSMNNSNNNNDGYHSHHHHRSILDMVIIRAPQQILNDDNVDRIIEYLSSTLPAASKFLESIVPGSRRSNAHGRPVRRHVHGVSHHLPGFDLQRLTEIADIFPPTRFALDPTNLRSSSSVSSSSNGNCDGSNIGGTPSRSNKTYGLSREIEAVIQNTDIIRVSPSTFQPQQPSFLGNNSNSNNDNNNSNVNNNDEVVRHGLFGTGTLFGEVWCAQELDGAHETYVICDDDSDNGNDNDIHTDNDTDNGRNEEDDCIDQEEDNVEYKTEEDITTSSFSSLADQIHTAFQESANWRAGAETRREEESKEATIAAANKYHASGGHFSSWMQGRYSPEVIESARVLGLLTTTATDLEEDDNNNIDGSPRDNRRLTTGMIKERWHALAFQSHPDTADDGSSSINTNDDKMTFSVLRKHYLILIAAARQDERKNNGAGEDASSY